MRFSFGELRGYLSRIGTLLGAPEGGSVVGIDIGTSSIKIVQLRESHGSAVLETYGEIALGPYAAAKVGQATAPPAEKIGEALTDLIREANVTAKVGGVSVPLASSLITLLTLPTKDTSELSTMVPIEARKYIPVPVSEVALDWFAIPEEEVKFLGTPSLGSTTATDILLVAIHRQTLTRLESIAKAAGITPSFFEIEPFSFSRASYEHGTAPTMLIDLGASATRVYVVEFGVIGVSHTINRGGQDITLALSKSKSIPFEEAEALKRAQGVTEEESGRAALEFIFSEARRILMTYQRKAGKAVSKVVLVGGGAQMKDITALTRTYFDAPVSVGAPFSRVQAPAFITDVLTSAGPSFASAVGLALRALGK
ncbi:type IV pilus assembly protein PilM [Patescibacteria group bacterium]|nr:type IV pilus assembly protein PilM [Patescibacteria group bacterium]